MNHAVDYAYDVFFSYKRRGLTAEWTGKVQEHLRLWLSEEIQRPVKMFVETIEIGDRWPDKLKDGLLYISNRTGAFRSGEPSSSGRKP
jgi:hypothetical protein